MREVFLSQTRDSALVKFDSGESGIEASFRNNKEARADRVRKLALRKGERVIMVGALNRGSQFSAFGFDIKRRGKVFSGSYSLIRGNVRKIVKLKSAATLYLDTGGKTPSLVQASPCMIKEVNEGDMVSCLCTQSKSCGCVSPCGDWTFGKCQACGNYQVLQRRYTALQIEKGE